MIELMVNGQKRPVDAPADKPLLWVLREQLELPGTKYGCGQGLCGACTVLIDGRPERACQTNVGAVVGKPVTTIEGIPADHPLKRAWVAEQVSQCGWCQPGQIVAATALLAAKPQPTDTEIDQAMQGNLCRCGTYQRIRRAIRTAAAPTGKVGQR